MRLEDWEITIEGDDVALSPLSVDDLVEMQEWPPSPDPLDGLWSVPPLEDDALEAWIAGQHKQGRALWAIYAPEFASALPEEWVLAGRLTLMDINERKRSGRIGLVMGREFAERGTYRAALTLFLDAYFYSAEYLSVRVGVPAIYPRQNEVYDALGFVVDGKSYLPAGIHPNDDAALAFLNAAAYGWARPLFTKEGDINKTLFYEMSLTTERWHTPG